MVLEGDVTVLEESGVCALAHTGDLTFHGPRPRRMVEALRLPRRVTPIMPDLMNEVMFRHGFITIHGKIYGAIAHRVGHMQNLVLSSSRHPHLADGQKTGFRMVKSKLESGGDRRTAEPRRRVFDPRRTPVHALNHRQEMGARHHELARPAMTPRDLAQARRERGTDQTSLAQVIKVPKASFSESSSGSAASR